MNRRLRLTLVVVVAVLAVGLGVHFLVQGVIALHG